MAILFVPKQVIAGEGVFQQLPAKLTQQAIEKPFVIFSESALKASKGWLSNQLTHAIYYKMPHGEPTFTMLTQALTVAQQEQCDSVVAIGGGSAIDLAKAVAVKLALPTSSLLEAIEEAILPRVPLFAVPTTAGTGAEASQFMTFIDEEHKTSTTFVHPSIVPDLVLLDPVLTTAMPKSLTVYMGLDALAHAIEAYSAPQANEMTDLYAREAIRLLTANLSAVYDNPFQVAPRYQMQIGSYYAGVAFSNTHTLLADQIGQAFSTVLQLPHSQGVALTYPFIVSVNIANDKERYNRVASLLGLSRAQFVTNYLQQLNERFAVWTSAKMLEDSLPPFSELVLSGYKGVPQPKITEEELAWIYRQVEQRLKNQ